MSGQSPRHAWGLWERQAGQTVLWSRGRIWLRRGTQVWAPLSFQGCSSIWAFSKTIKYSLLPKNSCVQIVVTSRFWVLALRSLKLISWIPDPYLAPEMSLAQHIGVPGGPCGISTFLYVPVFYSQFHNPNLSPSYSHAQPQDNLKVDFWKWSCRIHLCTPRSWFSTYV